MNLDEFDNVDNLDNTDNNNKVDNHIDTEEPVKLTKSIITSILYPLILIGISVFVYLIGETSLAGLIIAIFLSIAFGVITFMGGFYFFIIPLPFLNIIPNGCLRNLPKGKKVVLTLLCILSVILAFVFMYILR
ncbi:MAG: hypothetical protein J1F36_04890 [Clostridiales bacterium]|nr:hypothetical protein [Clostridiales bacterium]